MGVARMARLWLLVLVSLAVFCDNPEAGTIRVERDIASCQEVVKKHSACTAKAHDEYKNFFEKGDDGRPDWLARKTCNYMTESVEVCADLLSDCYSEEELTDQKDSTLKDVLEHITANIDEWDSEKCPPVKAYLDRQKTDETEVDKVEDETVVEEDENKDGENTNETVDEEKREEGSADGGNTEPPAEVENADNVDASPDSSESDGEENSDTDTKEENSENKTEDENSENNTETDNSEDADGNSDTKTDDVPEDGAGIVPAGADDTNVDDNEGKQTNDENGNSDTDDNGDNTNPDDDTGDNTNPDDDTGANTNPDDNTGDNTNADVDSGDINGKGGAASKAASLTILLAIV